MSKPGTAAKCFILPDGTGIWCSSAVAAISASPICEPWLKAIKTLFEAVHKTPQQHSVLAENSSPKR
jgi:hypothetical protein